MAFRKRFYLLVETGRDTRKLPFHADATRTAVEAASTKLIARSVVLFATLWTAERFEIHGAEIRGKVAGWTDGWRTRIGIRAGRFAYEIAVLRRCVSAGFYNGIEIRLSAAKVS